MVKLLLPVFDRQPDFPQIFETFSDRFENEFGYFGVWLSEAHLPPHRFGGVLKLKPIRK